MSAYAAVPDVFAAFEKPPLARAKEYFESGEYVWNSGIFVWKISTILTHFKKLLPDLYRNFEELEDAVGTEREQEVLSEVYGKIASVSVDYGIMEKSRDIFVVPAEFGWSDVGSWDMLGAVRTPDEAGNIAAGDSLLLETKNSTVFAASRMVALVGVEGLVVVETPDAVLVCPKDRAQDVKKIVDELREKGREDLL